MVKVKKYEHLFAPAILTNYIEIIDIYQNGLHLQQLRLSLGRENFSISISLNSCFQTARVIFMDQVGSFNFSVWHTILVFSGKYSIH